MISRFYLVEQIVPAPISDGIAWMEFRSHTSHVSRQIQSIQGREQLCDVLGGACILACMFI